MSQINPFTASLMGTPQAQRQAAAERDAEVRQARRAGKSTGAEEAVVDEFVESADAIAGVDNDTRRERRPAPERRPRHAAPEDEQDEPPHLDVTA